MKKDTRVKSTREFQRILNKRRFKNSKSFTVYTDQIQFNKSRFGISVPKKLGNAVLRNKTKRQVRSLVQSLHQIDGSFDYIIMVRKGFFEQSFEDNRKDLEKLLKPVKIVKENS